MDGGLAGEPLAGGLTPPERPPGVTWWASKAFWALSDQALFSISNFGLNLLLARWLAPTEYGAFAIAFSVFLLLGTVHTAFLTEPMMVFGAARYETRFSGYLRTLLRAHVAVAGGASLLLLVGALAGEALAMSPTVTSALLGLAVAGPFMLFQWIIRRACYLRGVVRLAALANLWYSLLIAGGTAALVAGDALTPFNAFVVMGVASIVSSIWVVHRLRIVWSDERVAPREAAGAHWRYGRWIAVAGGMQWLSGNLLVLVLPLFASLASVATLKAALNFVTPVWQGNVALASVLLPTLVRARRTGDWWRLTWLAAGLLMGGGALYGVALVVFGGQLSALVYAGRYVFEPVLLIPLAGVCIAAGGTTALSAALNAVERPDRAVWAYLAGVVATVTVGLALTAVWGVAGAAFGMLLAAAPKVAVLGWQVVKTPRPAGQEAAGADSRP